MAQSAIPDLERIARVAHERYLERELVAGRSPGESAALVVWEELPDEYREASRAQAQDIIAKLTSIGAGVEALSEPDRQPDFSFTAEELDLLARREHERWMAHKASRGWSIGPRDDALRTHPCLVPYDELPEVERKKDEDVVLEIPRLLRAAGYRIVRDREGEVR